MDNDVRRLSRRKAFRFSYTLETSLPPHILMLQRISGYNTTVDEYYLLAVVQQRFADFDGEARGLVEAIPFGVHRRTGVRVEGDVGPGRRLQGSRFRRRPTRTRVCKIRNKTYMWKKKTINNRMYIQVNKTSCRLATRTMATTRCSTLASQVRHVLYYGDGGDGRARTSCSKGPPT